MQAAVPVELCECGQAAAVRGTPRAAALCFSRRGVPEGQGVAEATRVLWRGPVELKEQAAVFLWRQVQAVEVVRVIFWCARAMEIELAMFGCMQVSALACVSVVLVVVVVVLLLPRVQVRALSGWPLAMPHASSRAVAEATPLFGAAAL